MQLKNGNMDILHILQLINVHRNIEFDYFLTLLSISVNRTWTQYKMM
jgi:hypothetical protein